MLKLLKPETRGSIRENTEEEVEEETRNFFTPTKLVRISSTQNDPNISRNNSCEKNQILKLPLHQLDSIFIEFILLKISLSRTRTDAYPTFKVVCYE